MNELEQSWEKVLDLLKPKTTPVSFDTWIDPLTPFRLDRERGTLYLISGDGIGRNLLEDRYKGLIEEAMRETFGVKLNAVFMDSDQMEKEKADKENTLSHTFTDELYLNPKYVFSTFVVGKNNYFAHAASLAVAEIPAKNYNPLFLYGASGLGKTHLMHAIGHHILRNIPSLKVLYVSSEMFTNELIKAIRENKTGEFKNKYRNIDVLLIDDIQFIEKKESVQEEIFHTINTLYDAGKQIILSSDRPPKEIATLNERLRSRFEWGLIADIQPPDFETRVAILCKKAEIEDMQVNEDFLEVIKVIAEKIQYNVRELEGAFIRVVAYASLTGQKITRDLAKEVLKDVFSMNDRFITPAIVKKYVCRHFNIKQNDMESAKRSRDLAFPRQIAMYICRDMTDLSLPKIGEAFGNRDHTTVLHACDKISAEIRLNESLKNVVLSLEDAIRDD
ncbi:MAG: chromosomal replication initiator protein DnaA [Eubacteriales bacterium]|nr:chromosomal replication initiator protein DnaA [Eubacteriales bacterium]MDD3350245.1 chromosomal replication initiator protein DnaA [Eubacteriales bacterium]